MTVPGVSGAPGSVPPDLCIVVVSYNTREMTLACLASIFAETRIPFEVVVVDNASSDGSAEAIAAAFPQVTLLAETVNHGFARAHDVALRHSKAPWVLLLNPDTVILDGAIDRLMTFAHRTPEAGIWGGRTLYPDGELNPYSCWARMTMWSVICSVLGLSVVFSRSSFFNPEAYGGWPRDSEREVDIVTGCFLLLRRDTWTQLGGFQPPFITYGEEADLCLRAREIGLRPRITPEATIIHYGGASETVQADKKVRLLRAKAELIKRHFPPVQRRLGLVLFRCWPMSRAWALAILSAVSKRAGLRDKAGAWRETWRRRHEWQEGFVPSD